MISYLVVTFGPNFMWTRLVNGTLDECLYDMRTDKRGIPTCEFRLFRIGRKLPLQYGI